MTVSSAAASATVRAIGPAVSCVCEIGTMPDRLTRPTVGLIPTSPLTAEGQTIDPSVSVPTPIAASCAAMAAPVPELDPQSSDHLVSKQRVGAFIGTPLDDYLRQRGVTQIFMTGLSTSIGVESTARSAYDLGYNVVFVTDAMTDRDADSHRHSTEKIFPRLGEVTTADAVLKLLAELPAG